MMETDGSDSGTVETLNGELKPDPAKLAQTAIIKQVNTGSLLITGLFDSDRLAVIKMIEYVCVCMCGHRMRNIFVGFICKIIFNK